MKVSINLIIWLNRQYIYTKKFKWDAMNQFGAIISLILFMFWMLSVCAKAKIVIDIFFIKSWIQIDYETHSEIMIYPEFSDFLWMYRIFKCPMFVICISHLHHYAVLTVWIGQMICIIHVYCIVISLYSSPFLLRFVPSSNFTSIGRHLFYWLTNFSWTIQNKTRNNLWTANNNLVPIVCISSRPATTSTCSLNCCFLQF